MGFKDFDLVNLADDLLLMLVTISLRDVAKVIDHLLLALLYIIDVHLQWLR